MKYLAIDYGLKRVGLAVSEGELASPYKVVEISSLEDALNKISHEITVQNIEHVVIGLPEGAMGKAVKRFMQGLKAKGIDIVAADETLSTKQAQKLMIEMGASKIKRKNGDSYAAAQILQNYLEEKVMGNE